MRKKDDQLTNNTTHRKYRKMKKDNKKLKGSQIFANK